MADTKKRVDERITDKPVNFDNSNLNKIDTEKVIQAANTYDKLGDKDTAKKILDTAKQGGTVDDVNRVMSTGVTIQNVAGLPVNEAIATLNNLISKTMINTIYNGVPGFEFYDQGQSFTGVTQLLETPLPASFGASFNIVFDKWANPATLDSEATLKVDELKEIIAVPVSTKIFRRAFLSVQELDAFLRTYTGAILAKAQLLLYDFILGKLTSEALTSGKFKVTTFTETSLLDETLGETLQKAILSDKALMRFPSFEFNGYTAPDGDFRASVSPDKLALELHPTAKIAMDTFLADKFHLADITYKDVAHIGIKKFDDAVTVTSVENDVPNEVPVTNANKVVGIMFDKNKLNWGSSINLETEDSFNLNLKKVFGYNLYTAALVLKGNSGVLYRLT